MRIIVGDIVHNEITNEIGSVVRIATFDCEQGYVVVIANKASGKEIETLWWPRELKEVRDGSVMAAAVGKKS